MFISILCLLQMPNSVDKPIKLTYIPPVKNNLSEQLKIFRDSVKKDQADMNKTNALST